MLFSFGSLLVLYGDPACAASGCHICGSLMCISVCAAMQRSVMHLELLAMAPATASSCRCMIGRGLVHRFWWQVVAEPTQPARVGHQEGLGFRKHR